MLKDYLPVLWAGLALGALVSAVATQKRGRLCLTLGGGVGLFAWATGLPLWMPVGFCALALVAAALRWGLNRTRHHNKFTK